MTAGNEDGRVYSGLWPLPGGDGHFLATLFEILSWIEQSQGPSLDDVHGWMRQRYNLGADSTSPTGYIQTIAKMGYLFLSSRSAVLTQDGRHLLQTRDANAVLDGLMRHFVATYDVLEAVSKTGTANGKTVSHYLRERFPNWKTPAQYLWRLQWLSSLGCIEKVSKAYVITGAGQAALEKYAHEHADPLSSSTSHKDETKQQVTLDTSAVEEEAGPSEAIEAELEPPVRMVRDEAEQLAARIRTAALESDDATGFERVLVEAFRFLGFRSEHKSGSGDTDVLVSAPLGQESYTSIVDGKSSRHGKVGKQQIDWYALGRHKSLHRADYILVVAPGFSSGDLLDNASKADAALLSADDLAAVVLLHASTPLSLTDFRELFRYAGRPELPLQRVQERAAEVARLQRLLPDILRTFEHSYQVGVTGPIAADALHLILAREYGRAVYSKDEIAAALDLLCTPLVGAIRRVTDTSFALQMPMSSVGRRFQAQARQLLEAVNTAEEPSRSVRGRW